MEKNTALPLSVLCQTKRVKEFSNKYQEDGEWYTIKAFVRYDDTCKNGHNDFAITGEIWHRGRIDMCGCIHTEITKHFPDLVKFLKWHLTSTDGPMHYIANTIYWAEEGNYENARDSAVWPEASDKAFVIEPAEAVGKERHIESKESLRKALLVRLPGLMLEFKDAVEELGFIY